MSFFSVSGIRADYGTKPVLSDVTFQVESGSLTGVLGANGSGKTTLLKALCGILAHEGTCSLEGTVLEKQTPKQLARLCSYIPQRSGIAIDISVLDVVLMGFNPYLKLLEHPTSAMKMQALHAIEQVGLKGRAQENYQHLSEGQKQLAILARTIASDSRMLLLDEPESSLDFQFRYNMLDLLKKWTKENQRAAVVTLHDPVFALNYCDQLIILHEGKVLGVLHPQMDPLDRTEHLLSQIYGRISLQLCQSRSGKTQLVMLKEVE